MVVAAIVLLLVLMKVVVVVVVGVVLPTNPLPQPKYFPPQKLAKVTKIVKIVAAAAAAAEVHVILVAKKAPGVKNTAATTILLPSNQ